MPTINPSLVPVVAPGSIFSRLTTDDTLNVRWLVSTDPVMYEALNRPIADSVLRQLIIAKAVDALQIKLGHQTLFPFLVPPKVTSGVTVADVPPGWIWDISMSLPVKWQDVRLAKIKRLNGTNTGASSDGANNNYTGTLRLIFSATQTSSATEVAIFYTDYVIDSHLHYQLTKLHVVTSTEEATCINPSEAETVAGYASFVTLDTTDLTVQTFYNLLAPNTNGTPAVYELSDTVGAATAATDGFNQNPVHHGTGLLTDSTWNAIPQSGTDVQSWVNAFNYPFESVANRVSTTNIVIPLGMFKEFDLCVPAGDEPTGDTTGTFFPVWISRVERVDASSNQLRFFFATHNVTETATNGAPSLQLVEFATLDLLRTYTEDTIVPIVPLSNLELNTSNDMLWQQGFGRGHVVLSSLWDGTTTDVAEFFNAFQTITDNPADTTYTQSSTRLSSFGLSRVPQWTPTIGQSRALRGSTSRLTVPVDPSFDNRYVNEQDQGIGNQIDLEAQPGISPHPAIDRFGFSGALCHRLVKMVVDGTQVGQDDAFYHNQVLPRLTALLGRAPIFGDEWFNGTRFFKFNGDTWVG